MSREGKRRILELVTLRMQRLAPVFDLEPPGISLSWDAELDTALLKTNVPPNTPLEPVPAPILELAEHIAITYLTRIRMHDRLDAMRGRTAVALTPRGVTEADRTELEHTVPSNSAYLKFQEAQMQRRTHTSRGPTLIPPTRNLPGATATRGPDAP